MVASWLLKGKTLPPRQSAGVLPRADLLDHLMASSAEKLTVLEAPAGFGKTTLLALWRSRLIAEGAKVAWLTLDRDDVGDMLSAYLALAFSEAGIDMTAGGLSERGLAPGKSSTIHLNAVLNVVSDSRGHLWLMLDDVEKVSDPEALRQIEKLIRYAPPNLEIALAFRSNPGLTLTDATVKGLVRRVDDNSLRFSNEEARAYLAGIVLPDQISTVLQRTEGWPVALQMVRALAQQSVTQSAPGRQPTNLENLSASYVGEQLFKTLQPHQKAFLRDIGLLEEVNVPLVEFVREARDTRSIFEELNHLSALIAPLDGAEDIFRIHPMFREYLCAVAARDTGRASLIHRRAATWLADRDQLPAALHHAMLADDEDLAATLIEKAGAVSIWIRSGMAKVEAANRIVDDAMIARYPRLGLMRCIVLIKQSRMREARFCYERVAALTGGFTKDRPGGDESALLRDSLFIRSMLALYGCIPLADDHVSLIDREMHNPSTDHMVMAHHKTVLCVSKLESGQLDAAWREGKEAAEHCLACDSIYGATFIDLHLGSIAMARGETQEAVHRYEKAARIIRRQFPHDSGMKLVSNVLFAELQLERDELTTARHTLLRVAQELHAAEAWHDIYAAAYVASVDLHFHERGAGEALAFIDMADRHVEHQGLGKLQALLDALRVEVLVLCGDVERALQVMERSAADFRNVGLADDQVPSWRTVEAIASAWVRLKIKLGEFGEAKDAALRARRFAVEHGLSRVCLRLDVLLLCIALAAGEAEVADELAANVLRTTTQTGYFRPVLREGAEIVAALSRITPASDMEEQALKEIAQRLEGDARARRAPIFSRREMDVLLQLNRGLQDKIIARRLGITEHTVRFHLKSIYAKTRAQGRLEAVAKVRAMGLLS